MSARSATHRTGLIEVDPRADGATRRVYMIGGRIVIDRSFAGMAMRIGLPCSAYKGVVLTLHVVHDAPRFVIRLAHDDPDLSVTLWRSDDDADVVAQWRAFANITHLPKFLEREPGVLESAERRLGQVVIGPAHVMRRRGSAAIRRRPRFLTRRRMGDRQLMKLV